MKKQDHTEKLKAGLYLVATPIGNLGDITLRAIKTLQSVDAIACEDTRVSGFMLKHHEIKKPLLSIHDHNELQDSEKIIARIEKGEAIALISDAGMPLISDPGYKLIQECYKHNVYVTSLPGANAPLMALQLSGLPSDKFSFLGFLPSKTKARRDHLNHLKTIPITLIFFESANRIEDSLEDILATLGDRQMALTRELTKMFEDVWRGKVSELLARVKKDGQPKGEIVLVIEGQGFAEEEIDLEKMLFIALENNSLKDAVAIVADQSGQPKKQVYERALENSKERPMKTSHAIGLRAEIIAIIYLFFKGYRVLKWRFKTPVGEIDIIAEKSGQLVCIEVKSRKIMTGALEAVTPQARARIARAARMFISRNPGYLAQPIRFDLIAIAGLKIRHLDNAWADPT